MSNGKRYRIRIILIIMIPLPAGLWAVPREPQQGVSPCPRAAPQAGVAAGGDPQGSVQLDVLHHPRAAGLRRALHGASLHLQQRDQEPVARRTPHEEAGEAGETQPQEAPEEPGAARRASTPPHPSAAREEEPNPRAPVQEEEGAGGGQGVRLEGGRCVWVWGDWSCSHTIARSLKL